MSVASLYLCSSSCILEENWDNEAIGLERSVKVHLNGWIYQSDSLLTIILDYVMIMDGFDQIFFFPLRSSEAVSAD